MTRKAPKRGLPPMHPGELLREILPALDRPKTEIAKLLRVSRQTLYDILDEKQPVTAVMALRLGKLCGNGPDLWPHMRMRRSVPGHKETRNGGPRRVRRRPQRRVRCRDCRRARLPRASPPYVQACSRPGTVEREGIR
jgi:antitoxin HigA-1